MSFLRYPKEAPLVGDVRRMLQHPAFPDGEPVVLGARWPQRSTHTHTRTTEMPARPSKAAPGKSDTISSADVLADFQVSGIGNVFLLGCLEKRVTLYSQQVRAINLAAALIDEGRIKANSRVAIIGGGAAGITAAAAIARAIPNIAELHVYERRSKILHLQTQSTSRYLHPHIYDWPRPASLQSDAGLPVLNWFAARADVVAEEIRVAFE